VGSAEDTAAAAAAAATAATADVGDRRARSVRPINKISTLEAVLASAESIGGKTTDIAIFNRQPIDARLVEGIVNTVRRYAAGTAAVRQLRDCHRQCLRGLRDRLDSSWHQQ